MDCHFNITISPYFDISSEDNNYKDDIYQHLGSYFEKIGCQSQGWKSDKQGRPNTNEYQYSFDAEFLSSEVQQNWENNLKK